MRVRAVLGQVLSDLHITKQTGDMVGGHPCLGPGIDVVAFVQQLLDGVGVGAGHHGRNQLMGLGLFRLAGLRRRLRRVATSRRASGQKRRADEERRRE